MKTNRKIDYCPQCGREEKVGTEMELFLCSLCLMRRVDARNNTKKEYTWSDLDRYRAKKKLSSRQLASKLNIRPSHLERIEQGKSSISKRISEFLKKEG